MTDYNLKRQLNKIARSLVGLESRLSIMERTAQAKFTSITDGSMTYYNSDGEVAVVVGKQPDGTYTTADANGAALNAPSVPLVDPKSGTLVVTWDGLDEFGIAGWNATFDHVEVHISTSPAFTPTDATEICTFKSLKGESVTLALDPVTYYVKFVAVNTSGVESAPSTEESATPDDPALLAGIKTYFENSAPFGLGASDEGAIWFDTDDDNKTYRWDGDSWEPVPFGAGALDTTVTDAIDDAVQGSIDAVNIANTKVTVYSQDLPPTGLTASDNNDLWIDTNDGNKTYRYLHGSTAGTDGAGGSGPWISVTDASLASINYVDTVVTTSASGKNKVTYSTGTPGSTANTVGDVWFQYNGSNQIIGQWRGTGGTSWTAVTLENSVIATLDAAKINTGFLDVANRIQAGSIAIGKVTNLQTSLDAKTTTFAQTSIPTSLAIGDLWVDTDDSNKTYRAAAAGATTIGAGAWVLINDPTTKTTTFAQNAIPTSIAAGDLWVDTDDSNKIYRAAAAGVSTIAGGAWVLVNDLTTKTKTFAQTSIPTSTTAGDLWVDTDDSNKLYRAFAAGVNTIGASAWVLVNDLTTKTTTFAQTAIPTSLAAGDLWVDTDDSNKLYRAFAAGVNTIGGSAWVLIDDPTAKTTTFAQTSIPVSTAAGDLWIDTDDSNKMYRAAIKGADAITAGEWELFNDPTSKVKTFAQTSIPTAVTAGDLWVDTDDNNKLYRAFAAGVNTIGASAWVLIQDAVGQVAALQTLWGHPSDTTFIDGGDVYTNSIRAQSLLLTDINNYLSDPGFTDTTSKSWSLSSGSSIVAGTGTTNGYMIMNAGTASTNVHSGDAAYWATEPGTEYQITGEYAGVGTNSGTVTFTPSLIVVDQSSSAVGFPQGTGVAVGTSSTWTPFSFNAVVPTNGAKFKWYPFVNSATINNKVWVRNIKVRRKSAGSLIVDGTITGTQISADTIDTVHLTAGSVKADQLDAAVLKAGFVLTGRIQVGSAYWTPADGLVIPQPGSGQIRLPADGVTPAQFDGHVTAKSATIEGNLNILGATNKVSGTLKLANGIVEPTVAPSVFQSWPKVLSDASGGTSDLDGSGTPWRLFLGMTTMHSNTANFVAAVQFGGTYLRAFDRSTGNYFPSVLDTNNGWQSNYNAWGGVTYTNGHYFTLGMDGNRSNEWWIYKISATTGAKVAEFGIGPISTFPYNPVIVADNNLNRLHVLFSDATGNGYDAVWNENLGVVQGATLYNVYGIPVNHEAAWMGNADFGSQRLLIAIAETSSVVSFTFPGLVFSSAESFANPEGSSLRGVWYDSTATRFKTYDRNGTIYTLSSWKTAQSFTSSYTWYDGNATGSTHETREGPVTTWTLPSRAHLNVETSVPPDSGNTDAAQTDKANRVGIYVGVGAGTRKLQSYLGVDGSGVSYRRLTLDTVDTGSASAPASNTFTSSLTPTGKIVSAAEFGGQPLLEISGSGTMKASTLNGVVIEDTGWIAMTLTNSWTNLGSPYQTARYCRVNGTVYIEGVIVPGTNGSAAFTLPAGFRPAATLIKEGNTNSTNLTAGRFDIATSGAISPQGAVTWLDISCQFRASA